MARWRIISGSRAFHSFEGRDISVGWARDLENRAGEQRTVRVCVATGVSVADDLPEEARLAIKGHGRSAVNAILDEADPPTIITVTAEGLVSEYAPAPEERDPEASEPEAAPASSAS